MKKIFYILGLFLLLIPFKVNALTPESLRIFVDNSSLTNTSTNVWYGKTTLYINSGLGFYSGGASRIGPLYAGFPTGLGCNNTSCLVSGTFASYTPNGFDSSVFEKSNVYIEYGGKYNACTINRRYTEQSFFSFIDFSCSGKNLNSSGFNLVVDNFSSFYDKDTFYGIVTDVSIQDNISTGDIIDSQNNNTQSIIDNQNKNTNEIKESIGSMGSSINSSIGGMKEKQDLTNDKLEEANQTSKGILGKIGDLLSSIIELPGKLVFLLIEGLKNLFVPTDDQLYEIINDSKDLAENFGFVGESMNFFITIFTSLLGMVNANGCVEFPEFTIGATSLTPSITFWSAHNVCLNDNPILSSNITTIRTITSIVLVALFINFAVSKFFSILNKNDSGTTYDVASDGTATIIDWTRTNGDMTRVRR